MRRSEINRIIQDAEAFFQSNCFYLPRWASWGKEEWKEMKDSISGIIISNLGWDITDFGTDDFEKVGLVLVTLRNGNPQGTDKPYAEKIMMVRENQVTPLHFHRKKTEDIINRGGGRLCFQFYKESKDGGLSDQSIDLIQDGISITVAAGEIVTIDPGMSLTLPTGVYHTFYAEVGSGPVMTGEVSMVNDDVNDNVFYNTPKRFPKIKEDADPYRYLVSDYETLFGELAGTGKTANKTCSS